MFGVICGVYRISSKTHPDRCYIGSAVNIASRWRRHRRDLRLGKHNRILQSHYNKYGEDDLVFSVIEVCEKHLLITREQFYINDDVLNCYFNVSKIAGSNLGVKQKPRSKEARENHRRATLGRKHSEETKKKLSEIKKNDPRTADQISKLAEINKGNHYAQGCEWNKGREQSKEEVEKRMSKIRGKPNKSRGVSKSAEHRRKISEALLGKKKSEEHNKHNSESHKGHKHNGWHHTDEAKQKMKEARAGWKPTEEQTAKAKETKRKKFVIKKLLSLLDAIKDTREG